MTGDGSLALGDEPSGFFGGSTQRSGDEALFYLADLSMATVFTNPFDDYASYGRDNTRIYSATEPIATDYLVYFRPQQQGRGRAATAPRDSVLTELSPHPHDPATT